MMPGGEGLMASIGAMEIELVTLKAKVLYYEGQIRGFGDNTSDAPFLWSCLLKEDRLPFITRAVRHLKRRKLL